MITTLSPGDGYELKYLEYERISIQVGAGGDCGIFIGACTERTFSSCPIFRVLVNQRDLKRNWKRVGRFVLNDQMSKFAIYGDADIGMTNRFKVSLDKVDNRVPISEVEFGKLERLAVWETIHILKRINQLSAEATPQNDA